MLTPEQLKQLAPRCNADSLTPDLNCAMEEAQINTPLRVAAFLAQIAHESGGLTIFEENLNYSWQRLRGIFRKYFPSDDEAKNYHRSPQRIANRVYANRMGNGDEASGDGWRYRGRGVIQLTGKENYAKCGDDLFIDLIGQPELAAHKTHFFRIACWFWNSRNLSLLADTEDMTEITRRINGGLNGLEDRIRYYKKSKEILGI